MFPTTNPYRAVSKVVAFAAIALATVLFAPSGPAQAQGFSVSPIRVEADVPSGRSIDIPFELSNSTDLQAFEMTIRHVDLLQSEDGSWQFEDTEELFDPDRHQSNREWFSNSNQTVTVGPQQSVDVILSASVPRNARGTSLSALLVTSDAQGDTGDAVRLRFQFLVPIILTISGRPARQNIDLLGLDMQLLQPNAAFGPGGSARAQALMNVTNMGETYSRVSGNVRVERDEGGNWRLVTNAEIQDRGIIPGSDLFLEAELGRSLPSGNYRLTGNLQVDGRQLPRMSTEVVFEGDPELDSIAYDTSILIDPEVIDVEVRPGASRSQAIKLTNPSDETVQVLLTPEIPTELENVAIGDLLGTDLSAASWVEVSPASVTLRPNSSRNVRLSARLPDGAPNHPYYYANIVAESSYPDGQTAGTTRAKVVLDRDSAVATQNVVLERLSYAAVDAQGEHVLRARVVNAGNAHTVLRPSAQLISVEGNRITTITMDGGGDLMLPFSVWDYAGVFDIGGLDDGDYILRASFDYSGNNRATQDLNVAISTGDDGAKTITASEE
jgi:hypothetical protein